MKVSIVIPAHNEESSIGATLTAALKIDYSDFEIIVVDNNCTDKTVEIARDMGVTVVSEKRKGTQWARECGRKAARGEIIANLDADCLPDSDWISKGTKWFRDKNVVAVGGPYDYYDSTPFFRNFSLLIQTYIYSFFNSLFQKIKKGAVTIGGNVFFRADALERAGGYNTNIVFYGDDTDQAKRMAEQGMVIFDTTLKMKTSARRLNNGGTIRISLIYLYHFFKGILFTSTDERKSI